MTSHRQSSRIESYATEDDMVELIIDGQSVDTPRLTVEQARAFAADLIETADYIERTES